jgi:peptidoglycan hydrolase-like protein with peptidoglycan-binding domain
MRSGCRKPRNKWPRRYHFRMLKRFRPTFSDGRAVRRTAPQTLIARGTALLLLALLATPAITTAGAESGKLILKPAPGSPAVSTTPKTPSRATVLEVQHLFTKLGYPLGSKALGGFGPRTKGALSYFQHKYGLPVTGLPDPKTLALMRSVAASLSGPSGHPQAPPKDLVDRIFGDHLPLLALAVALAAVLALLALNTRQRPV